MKNLGRTFTLTLTGNCNLNCSYCYEHKKTNSVMSFDTAKTILDKEMNLESEGITYIELFGGEPFLEFDLIKKIYDYVETNWSDKKWIMFATTNGTLIHGKIQDWLKCRKDKFVCGLSLDGTKEMHDKNRSNSFDKIDVDFFLKTYPNQKIKMTVSQETLPSLAEGVIYAHNLGFKVNCNLAFGIDWGSAANKKILERELKKLIDYYLDNPNIEPCSMLEMPIEHLGVEKDCKNTVRKWCGAGTVMHDYYVDGSLYPCQFFMPLSEGAEKSSKYGDIKFYEEIPLEKLDSKCQTCKCVEACPTCYGSNYIATGDIYKKDENLCELTKIILKARSYFKALQWHKGLLKIDKNREQALLKSILLIQGEV